MRGVKLLLDTHVSLWLVDGDPKLSATAQGAIADAANALFLSVASIWELSIKISRTNPKLRLGAPLDQYIAQWTSAYQIQELSIDAPHALQVVNLPYHHSDPFDRLLIAQSDVEAMTLVSVDHKFSSYSISLLW